MFIFSFIVILFLLMAQLVKNLPATLKIRVQSLGQEDPLEKGMATQSSILAWRIPWREDPGSPWDCKELGMTERVTHIHTFVLLVLIELYSLECSITTLACILFLLTFFFKPPLEQQDS